MRTAMPLPVAAAPPPWLTDEPYEAYAYSYPHKSAYGPLDPPIQLGSLWQAECRDALMLYFHVPFCEMRCGFCNLFARAGAEDAFVDAYLDAVERQVRVLAEATAGTRSAARLAVGGGTPTLLSPAQLDRLFTLAARFFDARPSHIPTSVETSPKTATPDRLSVLHDHGVRRVSIGVQSFVEAEAHAIGRPQATAEVHGALNRLRDFPVLNIDLIYGQPTQTVATWLGSIRQALRYRPEEIYLYPLYVRPGTGLGRRGASPRAPVSLTRQLYREGRDLLCASGYEQISMRFFQRRHAPTAVGPVYCCQTDGMLGLGCGARSYTSRLHYSSRFAVEAAGVQAILSEWVSQTDEDYGHAFWGIRLSEEDRRRRFVLQSLLTRAGLNEAAYRQHFEEPADASFPELELLVGNGLAEHEAGFWRLTPTGLELSDAIGPWLYSAQGRARLEVFVHP